MSHTRESPPFSKAALDPVGSLARDGLAETCRGSGSIPDGAFPLHQMGFPVDLGDYSEELLGFLGTK